MPPKLPHGKHWHTYHGGQWSSQEETVKPKAKEAVKKELVRREKKKEPVRMRLMKKLKFTGAQRQKFSKK